MFSQQRDNAFFMNLLIIFGVFNLRKTNFSFSSGSVRDGLMMSLLCAGGGPFSTVVAKRVSPCSQLTCLLVPLIWRLSSCLGV